MEADLKVLIVDDHPMFRRAIKSVIADLTTVAEVVEAENGLECIKRLEYGTYDVVLLDINMPEMDGIECFRVIKERWPDLVIIILTQFSESKFYRTLMDMGAHGYLLKSTTEDELIQSFNAIVFQGRLVTSDEVEQENTTTGLRRRELEVLELVCKQMSSEEIAKQLEISVFTVSNHRKAIMKKTGATSVAGMVKWASENGV